MNTVIVIIILNVFMAFSIDRLSGQLRKGNKDCFSINGEINDCINMKNCSSAQFFLENSKSIDNYICGYEGISPKVCCAVSNLNKRSFYLTSEEDYEDDSSTRETSSSRITSTTESLPSTLSSKLPLQSVCGKTNAVRDRIIGGETPKLADWPWIAALGYRNMYEPNNPIQWKCGGTLIADSYVLTTGYCTLGNNQAKLSIVRLGELNLDPKIQDNASPQDYIIAKIIVHEQYNSQKFLNDISLLKLKNPVRFNHYIQPICLPWTQKLRMKSFVKFVPTIAGWGSQSPNGPLSTSLMEIGLPILDNQKCNASYANLSVKIDSRVLCAGHTKGDVGVCQGDSGSPLMLPQNKNWYILGIASFGYKCSESGYPGVYTRITYFIDWIIEKMNSS